MGADIYDWERVHGKGSYQELVDGGCSDGRHQAGCSHGEPPYVPPATAALEAAWQATAGMAIESGKPWEPAQRAEFVVAAVRAAWPIAVAAERERILRRAFACRHCGQAHERLPEPVTPTRPLGYTYAVAADGHRFSPRFGEEWRDALADLLGCEGEGGHA